MGNTSAEELSFEAFTMATMGKPSFRCMKVMLGVSAHGYGLMDRIGVTFLGLWWADFHSEKDMGAKLAGRPGSAVYFALLYRP